MMGGAPSAAMMKQMQQKMFAKVDANKDGGIDKSEMTQFAQNNGLDTSKLDEMFKTADTDGNDKIDETEHSALLDKIGEKMKSKFGAPPTSASDSANSASSADDALVEMLAKIREHSKQNGGTDALRQFLSQLNQQNTTYDQEGAKGKSDSSLLLTQLA